MDYAAEQITRARGLPDQLGSMSTETYNDRFEGKNAVDHYGPTNLAGVKATITALKQELEKRGSSGQYGDTSEIRVAVDGQDWDHATRLDAAHPETVQAHPRQATGICGRLG